MTQPADSAIFDEWARRCAKADRDTRRLAVVALCVSALMTLPAWYANASLQSCLIAFAISLVCLMSIWMTLSRLSLTCPNCGQRPSRSLLVFHASPSSIVACQQCGHRLRAEDSALR
jgi:hypothetical protein